MESAPYDRGYDLAWGLDNEGKPYTERIKTLLDVIEGIKDYMKTIADEESMK